MFSGLLDTYKKELGEFVTTVKSDTAQALNSAKERLAKFNHEEKTDGQGVNGKVGLANIPEDFASFMETDIDEQEFEDFSNTFDLEPRRDQIENGLKEELQAEYKRYVVDSKELTDEEFWTCYFYFQHVQRRARLLAGDLHLQEEEVLSWGDDDDDDDDDDDEEEQQEQQQQNQDEEEKTCQTQKPVPSQADHDKRTEPATSTKEEENIVNSTQQDFERIKSLEKENADLRRRLAETQAKLVEAEKRIEQLTTKQETTVEKTKQEATAEVSKQEEEEEEEEVEEVASANEDEILVVEGQESGDDEWASWE